MAHLPGRVVLTALLVTVLGAGLWAWSRGLDGPYHFDDYTTPLGDPASQSLSAWRTHAFQTLRPVTKLTYAIEAGTSATDNPSARRLVSLAFHGVTSGLLMLLVARLVPGVSLYVAAVLAGIWFLHPVHADAVLLASGRTAVLSNLFVIGALVAVDRSRQWLAALLFLAACFSRETAIAASGPLAVLAVARHQGDSRAIVRRLMPLAAAAVLVLLWILTTPRYLHLAEFSMLGRPFWLSVARQVGAVAVGLRVLLQPGALSIDYGIVLPSHFTHPLFLAGALLYLGAAAGICFFCRRSPAAAVGLGVWLAALLPTQSVVPKLDALTNRPLSLALAGLLLAAAPLASTAFRHLRSAVEPSTHRHPIGAARVVAVGVAVWLIATLVAATADRAVLFQSERQLWADAAAKSQVNERPYVQYALLLKNEGRSREAIEVLSAAEKINPFSLQIASMSRVFRLQEVVP